MQALKQWGLLGGTCLLLSGAGVVGCQGFSADGTTCGPGESVCNDECFDLSFDPRHCGACGVRCPDGLACREGACRAVCTGGATDCGGGCVDLASDEANCGACGHACGASEYCARGVCVPWTPPEGGSGASPSGPGGSSCNGCNEPYPMPSGPSGSPPPHP